MVPYTAWHQHNADNGHSSLSSTSQASSDTAANGETNGNTSNAKANSEALYLLSAFIVHGDDINSGHYVSYARERKDWLLFDDSKIVFATEQDVLGTQAYPLAYVMAKV